MKLIKIIGCGVLAMSVFAVFADSAQKKLESMAKGRISGVTGVKRNDDNSIRSLLIIGRASLNKLLDDDEAEENAREDAEINASTAFSEYLNKSVTVTRHRNKATKTGSAAVEANDEVKKAGSAETISVKSQEFSSISKSIIAGMKEIYAGVHNNKYVIIYAWDKEETKQLKDISLIMSEAAQTAIKEAKDAESRLHAPTGSYQKPVEPAKKQSKKRRGSTIQEGGSASSDAGNYL